MADNTVTLTGTLGADPVQRSTARGDVTTFSLAYSGRIRGDDGSWSDGPTSWFEVAVWGSLGRNALTSLRRGQRAIVHGTVTVNEYPLKDGGTGRRTQIRASALGHDLAFGTTRFQRSGGQRPADPARDEATPVEPPFREESESEPQRELVGVMPEPTNWSTQLGADDDTPF